jgi:hypothetical protein
MCLTSLRVFHWNINGKNNNPVDLLIFKQFIYENSFQIISLNEAHSTTLSLPNYHSIMCSQDLSIFIQTNIKFRILMNLNIDDIFEMITIQILNNIVIFCYLRDGKQKDGINHLLEHLLNYYQQFKNVIVIGDLNARLKTLGNSSFNTAGRILDNFLQSYDQFICINEPFRFTFEKVYQIPTYRKSQSVIDLCLTSIEASTLISDIQVLSELRSDHFPVLLDLSLNLSPSFPLNSQYHAMFPLRSKNLQFMKVIPSAFKMHLEDELDDRIYAPYLLDSTTLWLKIEQCIYESLKKCNLLKKKAHRQNIRPLPADIWALRTTNPQEFRYQARNFRRNQWSLFVESIDSDLDQASIWRKFNNSLGRKRPQIKHGDSNVEVEHIKDLFKINSTPEIPPRIFDNAIPDSPMDDQFNINHPFSKDELAHVLLTLGNSSPGPDGIPYNIYKEFSEYSQSYILCFINMLFTSGQIPSCLKQCLQVALPKVTPGDYRPITLMNCILKIYESLVYNRIYPIIDPHLPQQQFGFRKNRSSSDQAANLIMNIQTYRNQKLYCGIIFIDIKKAFDRMDRDIVLDDLSSFGFSGNVLKAIRSLLCDNVYRVLFDNSVSSPYSTEAGCPQGSILSPLLWNFYFREVGSLFEPQMPFQFADDLALLSAERSHTLMISRLTAAFKKFNEWCYSKRIEVSPTKTKFMDVSPTFKKRKIYTDAVIRYKCLLTGNIGHLETVDYYKYLGITIDSKFNFNNYVSIIVNEVRNRTNLIRRISKTVKLSRKNIEKFYQGYVRGYLQYSSVLWNIFSSEQMKKIEAADRKGLSLCIGALLRTRNEEIERESTLQPLSIISKRAQLRLGCRILHTQELAHFRESIYDHGETSKLASNWISIWSHFELPRAPNITKAYQLVALRVPKATKDKTKYFKDFWKERLMARIRMNVLPTREWAFSLRLSASPSCRHCGQQTESLDHLFNQCEALDYSSLEEFYINSSLVSGILTFNVIREILLSPLCPDRIQLQESLCEFVRCNNLFKR